MATLLNDALVTDALTNLDEWSGDAQRISRSVTVDDPDGLVAAVGEAADAMDHHPQVERDGRSLRFVLWTHSAGGVTELDIALASRINDLIAAAQGRTAEAGRTVTAEPNFARGEQTTPSTPQTSSTGDAGVRVGSDPAADETMHEAATPRQGAGPVALPDAEPGSVEPQPGRSAAPGMHENVPDRADEV